MSKKELKEYSNFLINKKNLSDDINLANRMGINLDTVHLSHMEAVANNWRMGLAMDNIFLSKANLNQGLQRRMENLLEKTLKDINEVREFPNAKSAKADSIKIKNQLKDIEQQLIDNNLITKVQGKKFGQVDETKGLKPLQEEVGSEIRKKIKEKLSGIVPGVRDGGMININKLIRPL